MRFAYIGDHEGMMAFGLSFPIGEAVEVTDPAVIAKLSGNSHWRMVNDGSVAPEPTSDPMPKRRGRPPKVK